MNEKKVYTDILKQIINDKHTTLLQIWQKHKDKNYSNSDTEITLFQTKPSDECCAVVFSLSLSQLCVDPGSRLWSFIHSMFSLSRSFRSASVLPLALFWRKSMRPIPTNTFPEAPAHPLLSLWFLLRDYWFAVEGGFPSRLSHMFLFQDWWSCKRNPANHRKFLF